MYLDYSLIKNVLDHFGVDETFFGDRFSLEVSSLADARVFETSQL